MNSRDRSDQRSAASYFSARYLSASTQTARDELFYAVLRDYDFLCRWIEDTHGVAPPRLKATIAEVRDHPELNPMVAASLRPAAAAANRGEKVIPFPFVASVPRQA